MKVMCLVRADRSSEAGEMPGPEMFEKMGALMEEGVKSGVLVATDGLKPSSEGKRLKYANGQASITDGPFTESKELIASYAILEVKDMDEAVYWTKRFLDVLGEGEVELRPIFGLADFPADVFPPEEAAREQRLREEMERNAGR